MASSFTKQEMVAFDRMVEGFDDGLVLAKGATTFTEGNAQDQDRARDEFWIPAPMIGSSYDGSDATGHFGDVHGLSVPVNVGNWKHSAKSFSATQLRNQFTIDMWEKSARQKLQSDVNMSVFNTAALQGGIFSKRTAAAAGYDDVADLRTRMTRIGIGIGDRLAFYESEAAGLMAGNLAQRATDNDRDHKAYKKGLIAGNIAGFDVYENDLTILKAAAAGGVTTVNGANQRTVPNATVTTASGELNKDNRYTDLVVTSANYAGIAIGDAFTIGSAGTAVNELHLITKQNTGKQKTFRVIGKPAANTIRVYPAIVDAAEGSDASKEYANVSQTPANGATINWLNTVSGAINPFFKRESVLLIPGTFEVENGSGVISTSATTDLGVQITYTKQTNVDTLLSKCRFDLRWGTALTNPELAGAQMFLQT